MRVKIESKRDVVKPIGCFISGTVFSGSNRLIPITNPATGDVTNEVASADCQTVASAVSAAEDAFPAWRDTPPLKRARVLFQFKAIA